MPQLIVFSHLRWDFVYQRPQHLLSRLAANFPILFVEEPVQDDGPPHLELRQVHPGIEVVTPHTPLALPGFHDDQLPQLEPLLERLLRQRGIHEAVVWFYTPMALPLLRLLRPRAVVYDCMSELSTFKNAPRQLRQREAALLRRCDVVLAGGPSLYEAKRDLHPNVLCMPSAVDVRHYAPLHLVTDGDAAAQAAALQGGLPRPRLGCFGVIDERMDLPLIERLADADPHWQIVMVGPVVRIDAAALPRRPNLHWLGVQPYAVLPHLVAGWDVCLMPFVLDESTRFISPSKTLEYLAAEKPVVSTAVRDVSVLYGDVVHIVNSPVEFIAACRDALHPSTGAHGRAANALQAVSRLSWDNTARATLKAIEAVLALPSPSRADRALPALRPPPPMRTFSEPSPMRREGGRGDQIAPTLPVTGSTMPVM